MLKYAELFDQFASPLFGRYIHNEHIKHLLPDNAVIVGWSVEDREIYSVKIGSGPQRILIWSQMHGNETTTTKAIFDLLAFLQSSETSASAWLSKYTFLLVPILNPDGAYHYTRENAAGVDLNRDFKEKTQPETKVLWSLFNDFCPHICFNMHDQRTIYAVGETAQPATVSFLAPAYNEAREWNDTRIFAAAVIDQMNSVLQKYIPGQVGRYDDTYNGHCAGDSFQQAGVPTILFEAGHYPNDYQREQTRRYIFIALLVSMEAMAVNSLTGIGDYLKIPQNKVAFYDFIYRNVSVNYDKQKIITNFAAQYQEVLRDNTIYFEAQIEAIDSLAEAFGHVEFDADMATYSSIFGTVPTVGQMANFRLGNLVFINGHVINY